MVHNKGEDTSGKAGNDEAQVIIEEDAKPFLKPLSKFWRLTPECEDPNVLFEDNWLMKGGGLSIFGESGIGKSSLSLQMAMNWALGRPFMSRPMRPLKVAIIQSEDSERDVAEVVSGMKRGFLDYHGLEIKPEMFEWSNDPGRGCVAFWDFTGLTACNQYGLKTADKGDTFASRLHIMQQAFRADVVVINPVQAFCGGDVSNQAIASAFLRECLDPVAKSEWMGCAFVLFGHFVKPTKDAVGGLYTGAGSHEWTDWCRAKILMEPAKDSIPKDRFPTRVAVLSSVKRSSRLKWRNDKMFLMQGDGFQYWRTPTEEEQGMLHAFYEKPAAKPKTPEKPKPFDLKSFCKGGVPCQDLKI